MSIVISVQNVTKKYLTRKSGKKTLMVNAVNDVTFALENNSVLALLGPNGSGKTTIMKMILGLVYPDSGHITVLGNSVPENSLSINHEVSAILAGTHNIYWGMTIRENAYYFSNLKKIKISQVKQLIEDWAKRLNIENRLDTQVGKLSSGMKQKASLLCALISRPSILILDEPLLGLDIITINELERIITELAHNTSIIFSSHDLRFVEKIADKVILLKEGNIVAEGTVGELKRTLSIVKYQFILNNSSGFKELSSRLKELVNQRVIVDVKEEPVIDDIVLTLSFTDGGFLFSLMEMFGEFNIQPLSIKTLDDTFEEMFLDLMCGGEK